MGELRTVEWEEISDMAESLFRVWTDGREMEWAKKSWRALCRDKLTSYKDKVEKTGAMIKLIALADIYRGFCRQAFDESYDPEYAVWAREVNLNAFRVAQCVGPQFERDEEADDNRLLDWALSHLIEEARPALYEVLKAEFGDDSLLFVSLWSTADYERNENGCDDGEVRASEHREIDWAEDAYWILNTELTGEKQRAFNWVCQGFSD
jgi:hypothetical protein